MTQRRQGTLTQMCARERELLLPGGYGDPKETTRDFQLRWSRDELEM